MHFHSNPTMRFSSAIVWASALCLVAVDARSASSVGASTLAAPRSKATAFNLKAPVAAATSIGERDTPTASIAATTGTVSRGGAAASDSSKQITGAAYFVIMDIILRKLFTKYEIPFPSQLGGCCILFALMVVAELIRPGFGDAAFDVLSPGATILAKWLPVFFVPGLAMLPLAPSMGSPFEAVKVFSTVFIGFFFSLFTTTFSVLGLRKLQGTAVDAPVEAAADAAPAGGSAPKAFSDEMMDFMLKGTVLSGAISIAASKTDQAYKTPLQTIFMGFATFTSFIWGARMPAAVTKFLHPILTSTGMTFATARLIGMATGSSFVDVLKEYKCGSLGAMTAGAGDLILYMLGPAVISFAIAMYSRKGVIASNLPTVTTGVAMGSAGGLFGTAAFARALGIGGPDGCMVRLSTIPRNITTALAMVIAKLLGGDTSIAAVLCVLTGMFAAMVGAKTLDAWGVTDPVSRGLGLGAAGQSLGAASISHEKEAFPFAAVNMVLTAVFATVLASIPAVSDALIGLSCGSPEPVVSTAA